MITKNINSFELHANTDCLLHRKKCYKEISNATVMGLNPMRAQNHLGLDFSNNYVCFLFEMIWLYS